MFSGLVQSQGIVVNTARQDGGVRLHVRCEGASDADIEPKDSIALAGVCLTAIDVDHNVIAFDVVPETLERSTLGALREGDAVNVEYALRAGDALGGHFVYGHVDGTVNILSAVEEGQGKRLRIVKPPSAKATIVQKGFVALDGVSLTVAATGDGWFEVAVIPETLRRTSLGRKGRGDALNLEVDPIARYVAACIREVSR